MTETISMGGLQLEFLHSKDDTDNSLDIFRMTVQPKARVPAPHYHESWDETVYGLDGTVTFTVDGETIALEPGQSVFIRRGVVHHFRNDSETAATCLCILTPGVLGPAYFRELAALIAAGPPDPVVVKEIMTRYRLVPVAPGG
jgi:quercetin dioxygenase-like cupin family protein